MGRATHLAVGSLLVKPLPGWCGDGAPQAIKPGILLAGLLPDRRGVGCLLRGERLAPSGELIGIITLDGLDGLAGGDEVNHFIEADPCILKPSEWRIFGWGFVEDGCEVGLVVHS